MYTFRKKPKFERKYRKLVKKNFSLEKTAVNTLRKLSSNPFDRTLKTHNVEHVSGKIFYSSFFTGDLRLIWSFTKGEIQVIELIDIGGHSGGKKLYK